MPLFGRNECGTSRGQRSRAFVALLLGETGSGKSTLINYLTNFFRGGSLIEPKIVIPNQFYSATESISHSEKNIGDQTRSKTANCQKYKFSLENNDFCFIDSPGLSDTNGVEQDDRNISQILTMAEQRGTLSAIVLIINGTVARATVNMRTTLTRLHGSLPDLLLENLIIVLTNCTPTSYNFDFKSLKPWKIKPENVFIMDNSALSRDPSGWKNNNRTARVMDEAWAASMDEIQKMVYRISDLDDKSTGVFKDLRTNREKMKEEMHAVLLEIKKLQKTHDELQTAQSCYETAMNDTQKYSNFKRSKDVEYTVLVEAEYYSTICMIHTEQVCHDRCGLPETAQSNSDIFRGCACMNGPRCTRCECGHETHYHARKKLGKTTKTVEEILQDVKKQYDTSTACAKDSQITVAKLGDDLKMLEKILEEKQGKIEKCCREMQRVCSAFNFVDEMYSVLDTMEANARTLTSLKARSEADKMFKSLKELVGRLHAGQSSNPNSVSEGQDCDAYYQDFDSGLARSRVGVPRPHRQYDRDTDYGDDNGRNPPSTLGQRERYGRSPHDTENGEDTIRSQRLAFPHHERYGRIVRETEDREDGIRDRSPFSHRERSGRGSTADVGHAPDRTSGIRFTKPALLELPTPSQEREYYIRRGASPRSASPYVSACRHHNSTGCRMVGCKFPHVCGRCSSSSHVTIQCPNQAKLPATNAVRTLLPGACRHYNSIIGCQMKDCNFLHVCGYCVMGNHTALQCRNIRNVSVTAVAPQGNVDISPSRTAKDTPCKYYNQESGCRHASCGFSHKCSNCGKLNHGVSSCQSTFQGPPLTGKLESSGPLIKCIQGTCFEFNHGKLCKNNPCPYKHFCGVCGQLHSALEHRN